MQAGKELDKRIATEVMGKGWCQLMHENACLDGKPRKCACGANGFPYEHHAPYSTDISAAWEVVDKLTSKEKPHFQISICDSYSPNPKWLAEFDLDRPMKRVSAKADTAPLAICLAALKAVGHTP